ncbi:MAG: DNA polymerase II large subunit [Thermoplasmata archaeon]
MTDLSSSQAMREYLEGLNREAEACYSLARRARAQGMDPELSVEVLAAEDLPSRVERLLEAYGLQGVGQRIRELSAHHDREETSLLLARELAQEPGRSVEERIERAIRAGLALLTEGVVVAPLEGLGGVQVKRNEDGTNYLDVFYAGPIRSAGGTAQALSVLIADVVRRELGIGAYQPTKEEVERLKEEIPLYKRLQHLQHTPSGNDIELVVGHCPVGINGEGTEEEEISGHRDLPRVETNRIRGGACLVIAEGLCLKAPKILKHVRNLQIDGWDFLTRYVEERKNGEEEADKEPSFIQNIIAGRPVLAHPSRKGGFRLRYGRTRATGLAALGVHPATMHLVDDFVAVGTQIKVERPGKAGAVSPCETIEGPLVLLKDGSLTEVSTLEEARRLRPDVVSLVDLGELLVAVGEFLENNHALLPGAYGLDWYRTELELHADPLPENWERPAFEEAEAWSREYGVPMHPRFNLFWHELSVQDLRHLREELARRGRGAKGRLEIPADADLQAPLVELGALFRREGDTLQVGRHGPALLLGLGLSMVGHRLQPGADVEAQDPLEYVSRFSGIPHRARGPTRIGARMGRPEKARPRLMKPPPHALFPLGVQGGPQRLLAKALEKERVVVEVGLRKCAQCGRSWFLSRCPCGGHTVPGSRTVEESVPLREVHSRALQALGLTRMPGVKLVQGMISRLKTPEALEKGLLRAKHEIHVFKDGTCRFDMTNLPLTHFRPGEVGLSVPRARELGYETDVLGEVLAREDQLVELRPQDLVVSTDCAAYLVRVGRFVDDLLALAYGLEPHYGFEETGDVVGHLVMGLAPHTSVGVLARIVGLTPARACFAHPYFHAAKRRDADGDEDSVILLLDGLLNFSRGFLPEKRGGLMDAPLVLSTRIDPKEVDREVHNLEVCGRYPLEFFEAAEKGRHPREVENLVDTVAARVGSVLQFEGFGFTHEVDRLDAAPLQTAYTEGGMLAKIEGQLALANRIRAVNAEDVVARIVNHHFLPDLIGNLRAFTSQRFRCTKCGAKYRRMPLAGSCLQCKGKLTLTVHKSGVVKYLELSKRISEEYQISPYLRQRIGLVEEAIASIFSDESRQVVQLEDFLD